MRKIISQILELRSELEQVKTLAVKSLKKGPVEGRLRMHRKRGVPHFYLVLPHGSANGRYLSRKDDKLLRLYCQRDYDKNVVQLASSLIESIDSFLKSLQKNNQRSRFQKQDEMGICHPLSEVLADTPKRKYIHPYVFSDSEFRTQWASENNGKKSMSEADAKIQTNRGEFVRSKSEKIIADFLLQKNIPYKYERPLILSNFRKGKITIHPDFTILDEVNRSEIYFEHFGMMDNPDYASRAVERINLYLRNGYCIGKNFFFTFETSENPLDVAVLKNILQFN